MSGTKESVQSGARALWRSMDKIIHFQVQGALLGIPQSQLQESEFFTEMLSGEHIGEPEEGSFEHPIILKGVDLSAVDSFLKVLQARTYKGSPEMSIEEWSEGLRIATMWRFDSLRRFMIQELDPRVEDPITRLELAEICEIREWLVPAFARLCVRSEPFTTEEARRIGYERVLHAWRVRDGMLKEKKWSTWYRARRDRSAFGFESVQIGHSELCGNCSVSRVNDEPFCLSCGVHEVVNRLSSITDLVGGDT